jgi:hypothetical protein
MDAYALISISINWQLLIYSLPALPDFQAAWFDDQRFGKAMGMPYFGQSYKTTYSMSDIIVDVASILLTNPV